MRLWVVGFIFGSQADTQRLDCDIGIERYFKYSLNSNTEHHSHSLLETACRHPPTCYYVGGDVYEWHVTSVSEYVTDVVGVNTSIRLFNNIHMADSVTDIRNSGRPQCTPLTTYVVKSTVSECSRPSLQGKHYWN